MSEKALTLESLVVRRGHHFVAPGVELDALSPGINIIFGPNASGKTTLASAIRTLLWPEQPVLERAHLVGVFDEAGAMWRLEFDDGRVSRQLDGRDVTKSPSVAGARGSDRYHLCLRELLATEGENFAAVILRESAGGYDVTQARETLGYSSTAPRVRKATTAVQRAKKRWRESRAEQEGLRDCQPEIERLNAELHEARQAAARREAVRRALEFNDAAEVHRRAQDKLQSFPEVMANVAEDEEEQLQRVREELRRAGEEEAEARRVVEACEAAISESPIPADGVAADVVETLDSYASGLEKIQAKIESARGQLAQKVAREESARRYIADEIEDEGEVAEIGADAVREVERLAQQINEVDGRRRAYDAMASLLGGGDGEASGDPDELRAGIEGLRSWLRGGGSSAETAAQQTSPAPRLVLLASAMVVGLVALTLAIVIHIAWLLMVLVSVAMGWVFFALRRRPAERSDQQDRRQVYRRDFERLSIDGPHRWDEEGVEERLVELVDQWIDLRLEREKERRWQGYQADHQGVLLRHDELLQRRRTLAKELSVDKDERASSAYWLISKIHQWQQACAAREGAAAELRELNRACAEILEKADRMLRRFGYEETADVEQAKGRIQAVKSHVQRFESNRDRLESAQSNMVSARDRRQRAQQKIDRQFQRLNIEGEEDRLVADLCSQIEAYEAARDEFTATGGTLEACRNALHGCDAFSQDLLEMSNAELRRELQELDELVQKQESLVGELKGLEARVASAKENADVEQRRAEYEALREALRRERERDMGRAIGAALVDHLQEQTRDRSRPAVFHRARELFSQFTRGRFSLELSDDADDPAFYAFDTTQQVGLQLDELSGGTRVQLFLAVRVAFVELREEGSKAPMIIDEALANSDDLRAAQIIEAIRQIGEQGRQIFYFTAQLDEVQKWRRHLDAASIDWKEIDLARLVDGQKPSQTYGEEVALPRTNTIAAPKAMSHDEYGEVLGVRRGLDPWRPMGDVHLWYLVEDTRKLYALLNAGISRWGQLRELVNQGGGASVDISNDVYQRIAALADILGALAKARAVGRGPAVGRGVLEDSGAVSDTFIDRVSEICDEVGGDAQKLLDALEAGRAKRFRSDNIEALRQYLIAEGYLDEQSTYDRHEIWVRVRAAASPALERGLLDEEGLRRLVERATGVRRAKAASMASE